MCLDMAVDKSVLLADCFNYNIVTVRQKGAGTIAHRDGLAGTRTDCHALPTGHSGKAKYPHRPGDT